MMRSLIPMLTAAMAFAMPAGAAEPARDHVYVDTHVVLVGNGTRLGGPGHEPLSPPIDRDPAAVATTVPHPAGDVVRGMALAGGEVISVVGRAIVAGEARPVVVDDGDVRTGQPAVRVEARRDGTGGVDLVATVQGPTPLVKRWNSRLRPGETTLVDLPVAGARHYYVVVGGAAGA